MTPRFTLKHQLPVEALQFTNNEFEVSIAGWSQIAGAGATLFTWNNPSSARASGPTQDTAGIGMQRPDKPAIGWPPGTYTVAITATNASTGGSSPFQSLLNIWGSADGVAFDTAVIYTGTGTWDVGAGEITRAVVFTLTTHQSYLFFKFTKVGPTSGYNVDFTIDTIELTRLQNTTDNQEIAEPGGWNGHEIKLERHPEFGSLIESIFNQSKLVFIGDDNEDGNGGIDFILNTEINGVDEKISILIEYAPDDVNFEDYFTGKLQLEGLIEFPERELEIPILREDKWQTFIKRIDTPVDLTSTEDLDGNAVDAVEHVTLNLTSQTVDKVHYAVENGQGISVTGVDDDEFIQYTPGFLELDELTEVFQMIPINSVTKPSETLYADLAGSYVFDVQWTISNIAGATENHANGLDIYFQLNEETPIAFGRTDQTLVGVDFTIFTYNDTHVLKAGDYVRLYAVQSGTFQTLNWGWWGKDGLINAPTYDKPRPAGMDEIPTYTRIVGSTVYPETQVVGYWLHDVFAGILARIGADPLYSEILGATYTKTRQYDADGCFANFFLAKGVHVRGYNLTEEGNTATQRYTLQQKPFSMSFKECWDGANPIFNLGLGYEVIEESPEGPVIRIEGKDHFFDTASGTSVNFPQVYDIKRLYDKDYIFKKIVVGYNKWESESFAGIDDPQTKHTYATRFSGVGKDINLISKFIAASLAIETTRRMTVEKSADYKFDNDTFIIAVNVDNPDPSPLIFEPELDENFVSVTNLKHSDTRYNLILTPLRNFLRWGNYLSGCLQTYLTSAFKFQAGEGNFDMQSQHACSLSPGDKECQAIICDEVTESQDIDLTTYADELGFLHLSFLYEIRIAMEWEEYRTIRDNPKKPIGISQTDSGFTSFYIKDLSYNLFESKATILAWSREYFEIQVVDQELEMDCPPLAPVVHDSGYQAILDYADTIC